MLNPKIVVVSGVFKFGASEMLARNAPTKGFGQYSSSDSTWHCDSPQRKTGWPHFAATLIARTCDVYLSQGKCENARFPGRFLAMPWVKARMAHRIQHPLP